MPVSSTGSGSYGGGTIFGSTGGIGTVNVSGGSYIYNSITGTSVAGADGTITIENGADVTMYSTLGYSVFVGVENYFGGGGGTATATLNVDGAGSSLVLTGAGGNVYEATFISGTNNGTGTINVTNGGYLSAQEINTTGFGGSGTGTFNIDGSGSLVLVSGDRGAFGDGMGGFSTFGSQFTAGRAAGSNATVNITNAGRLVLESASAGAPARDGTRLIIGEFDGSTGSVTVDGTGSSIQAIQRANIAFGGPSIEVGVGGQGTLTLRNGGTAEALGANARVTVAGGLYDGTTGAPLTTSLQSLLRVETGGTVLIDSQNYTDARLSIGLGRDTNGRVEVDGIGSSVTLNSDIDIGSPNDQDGLNSDYGSAEIEVGRLGYGALQISNGASVSAREIEIGEAAANIGAQGETIDLTFGGYLANPDVAGVGVVDVISGGQLILTATDNAAYRGVNSGQASGSIAVINVDGDGSALISQGGAGRIRIANYGQSTLNVTNGGDVYGFFVDVGRNNGGRGTINVAGTGSTLTVSDEFGRFPNADFSDPANPVYGAFLGEAGFLRLGRNDGGYGRMNITAGGVVDVINDPTGLYDFPAAQLGRNVGSEGVLDIDGLGSQLNVIMTGPTGDQGNPRTALGPELVIGDGGLGTATVRNDAQINILGSDALLNIGDGRYVNGLPTAASAQSTLQVLSGADVVVDSQNYGSAYSAVGAGFDLGATVDIGRLRDTDGKLTVDGAGSTFTVRSNTDFGQIGTNEGSDYASGRIDVGERGAGALEISNGGAVFGRELEAGIRSGTIDGTGQTVVDTRGYLAATDFAGTGVVDINTGGSLTLTTTDNAAYRGVDIGIASGTSGQITVDGTGSLLTSQGGAGRVSAGRNGTGEITIQNGGSLEGFFANVGVSNGGVGRLTIDGAGSTATFSDAFGHFTGDGIAGNLGDYLGQAAFVRFGRNDGSYGKLTVSNGGALNVINDPSSNYDQPILRFAHYAGSTGYADIYGAGSQVNVIQTGLIGAQGNPVSEGGPQIQLGTDIVYSGGGGTADVLVRDEAAINLSGDGATFTVGHGLDGAIGDAATSTLRIQSGADVNIDALNGTVGAYLQIGLNETGNGVVTIDGAGSTLSINSDVLDANEGSTYSGIVNVGRRGDGKLYVTNGGSLSIDANDDRGASFDIGFDATGIGLVQVDTGGSILVQGSYDSVFVGTIDIGRLGQGTLTIAGGGTVTNAATDGISSVGREAGSSGLLTVDGATSQFSGGTQLVIGSDFDFATQTAQAASGGTGIAVLTNGGGLDAGEVTVGSSGLIGGQGDIGGNLALVGGRFGLDGTVAGASARDDVTVTGNLTADAASVIEFDIDGFGAGEFDAVSVTGTANLDSDALLLDLNAAIAAPGSTATLISAGNLVTSGDTLQTILTEQFGGTPVEAASTLNGLAQGRLLGNTGSDLVIVALNSSRANDTATVDFGVAQLQGVELATVNGFGVGSGGGYSNFNVYGITAALGTAGGDTITMSTTSDLLIDGRDGNNTLTSGQGDDLILSGAGADIIAAGDGDDQISAGAGIDTIIAGVGNDLIRSGLGADNITFGDGAGGLSFGQDQLWGTVDELDGDTVTDFQSNDAIGVLDAGGNVLAASLIVGGGEIQIDVGSNGVIDAVVSVSADLFGAGTSLAGPNPFGGVPNIQGGPGDSTGSNVETGTTGDDVLNGTADDDSIVGLSGNDTLNGGAGSDTMDGGPGDDRFFVDDAGDVVIEALDEGRDTLTTSVDFVLPENVEIGSMSGSGDISLTGNALANTLAGNGGDNDLLGLAGADRLRGGAGNDTLEGGLGNDILEGQGGSNLFVFGAGSGDDLVLDWQTGIDLLDFEPLGLRFVDLALPSSGNEALITFEDGT
ncbi:MAG: hypothetical protein AAGD13_21550, partial [Pseudomonadota bacterium]